MAAEIGLILKQSGIIQNIQHQHVLLRYQQLTNYILQCRLTSEYSDYVPDHRLHKGVKYHSQALEKCITRNFAIKILFDKIHNDKLNADQKLFTRVYDRLIDLHMNKGLFKTIKTTLLNSYNEPVLTSYCQITF